jgi:hypothetical protein
VCEEVYQQVVADRSLICASKDRIELVCCECGRSLPPPHRRGEQLCDQCAPAGRKRVYMHFMLRQPSLAHIRFRWPSRITSQRPRARGELRSVLKAGIETTGWSAGSFAPRLMSSTRSRLRYAISSPISVVGVNGFFGSRQLLIGFGCSFGSSAGSHASRLCFCRKSLFKCGVSTISNGYAFQACLEFVADPGTTIFEST